jgi:hypothetical protein
VRRPTAAAGDGRGTGASARAAALAIAATGASRPLSLSQESHVCMNTRTHEDTHARSHARTNTDRSTCTYACAMFDLQTYVSPTPDTALASRRQGRRRVAG